MSSEREMSKFPPMEFPSVKWVGRRMRYPVRKTSELTLTGSSSVTSQDLMVDNVPLPESYRSRKAPEPCQLEVRQRSESFDRTRISSFGAGSPLETVRDTPRGRGVTVTVTVTVRAEKRQSRKRGRLSSSQESTEHVRKVQRRVLPEVPYVQAGAVGRNNTPTQRHSPSWKSGPEVRRRVPPRTKSAAASQRFHRGRGDRKSVCPLPGCTTRSRKLKMHVQQAHLPIYFDERIQPLTKEVVEDRMRALYCLSGMILGPGSTLKELQHHLNTSHRIPADCTVTQKASENLRRMCRSQGWRVPAQFQLQPMNSLACLVHWRALVALLVDLDWHQLKEFRTLLEPVGERVRRQLERINVHAVKASTSPVERRTADLVPTRSCQESSDEEFPVEAAQHSSLNLPEAIDSHCQHDRMSGDILGRRYDTLVEELFNHPQTQDQAQTRVENEGGVMFYCDPATYPRQIDDNPSWKTAIGIHPKHVRDFGHTELGRMVDLLTSSSNVRALGVVGLDRTTPPHTWAKQEQVLKTVLRLQLMDQVVVLELRGTSRDPYGSDVHRYGIQLMRTARPPTQVVHVYNFTGKVSDVAAWRQDFPKTYFSFNTKVETFDWLQLEGLRAVPLKRLLLETDSHHIRDIAVIVARARGISVREVLHYTTSNARAIYWIR
ncbi:uncharacterized protein LOC124149909 [Haliotis rufescens]|uniref:uncharacterized protein LOC124149909 n=1 Tax=Haliotis rufescens TaxID=6454 RepID=UPI00201F93C5|nr:uncharacterized protein LOC124149909 [Haliotis rufescens]